MESTFYRYINNTVKKSQYDVTIPGFLGGKSGFTDEARYNLASFARYPGGTYVLLTAKAGNSYYRPSHVLDAEKIYRHYFQNFHKKLFVGKEQVVAELPIKYNYFRSKVALVTKEDIFRIVNRSASQQLRLEIPEKLEAPISSSKAIGKLSVVENNEVIHQVAIYPSTSVSKHHTLFLFAKIFSWIKHNWMILLCIVIVIKLLTFRRKKIKIKKRL